MSTSPIASCVSPTFPTSLLIGSAAMKRHFGARPPESFTRWKYWIAVSPKREGVVLGSERKLTSIANDSGAALGRSPRRWHRLAAKALPRCSPSAAVIEDYRSPVEMERIRKMLLWPRRSEKRWKEVGHKPRA